MNKELLRKLYHEFENADLAYVQYVDQFLGSFRNDRNHNDLRKTLTRDDLEIIGALRVTRDKAWADYKHAFSSWLA